MASRSAVLVGSRPRSPARERSRFEMVESYRRLAVIRSAQGRHAESATNCLAGLNIEPDDAHLRYLRIESLKAAGRSDDVKRQLEAIRGATLGRDDTLLMPV